MARKDEYKTICVAKDVGNTLETLRKKEEARTGFRLSWTQFFRGWLKNRRA